MAGQAGFWDIEERHMACWRARSRGQFAKQPHQTAASDFRSWSRETGAGQFSVLAKVEAGKLSECKIVEEINRRRPKDAKLLQTAIGWVLAGALSD